MQRSLTGDAKVREIYAEALKRPIAERMSYVASRTTNDLDLRRLVELMLAQGNATALHSEPARRRSINRDVGAIFASFGGALRAALSFKR
jgi:hypothetical protein